MNRKSITIAIIIYLTVGCNNTNCKNAIVDEKFEIMENYNKSFREKDFTGKVIDYYDEKNEQKKWVVSYEEGEITKYESFNKNGTYNLIKPMKCRSKHGNVKIFMDNNQVGYELEYSFGRKDGVGKSYYKTGKTEKIVTFKNDLKEGKQYDLTINGDTILVQEYKKGKLINEFNPHQSLKNFYYKMAKDSSEAELLFNGIMNQKRKEMSDEVKKSLENAVSVEELRKSKKTHP